jgi:glycosyltransferase involved in cell wall biosynthesis
MTPLVSVCIPVFNGEEHLGSTIESVLSQTFDDFELVISDNCSTDGTSALVAGYAARDSRVRLLSNQSNIGAIANWNRVRAAARGQYVKLLAADDLLFPECLERQTAPLEEFPSVVLVAGPRDIIDETGRVLLRGRGLPRMSGVIAGGPVLHRMVRTGTNLIGEPPFALIRKTSLERCRPFSDELPYLVDLDLWCQLLQQGDLYAVGEAVGAFRVRLASESVAEALTQGRQSRALYRRLRRELPMVVSETDVALGSARAAVLAHMRRLLYTYLRLRVRFGLTGAPGRS